MSLALPIAAPPTQRRGACPSLDAPMQTGDGLLARLRVAGGRLTPAQLTEIASLAGQHGNGLVEITARGNLQVRGLTPASAKPFAAAVEAIIPIERGLVVETPPLAGDDPTEIADPRPVAEAIRNATALLADRLGPKVTVVVDGGGQIGLDDLKADIRLTATSDGAWLPSVGGVEARAVPALDAVAYVVGVLNHLAALGPGARAEDVVSARPTSARSASAPPIGPFRLRDSTATGIALPFGSSDHATFTALAAAASHHGITEFRLAPHHALLAIGAPDAFVAEAQVLGLITDPADPRTRISACIGSDGCASGHVPARAIAARLASSLPAETTLHVSGCSKGCAHPRRAALTLVGRPDGCGLVMDGMAGDTPQALLQADGLESAIARAHRQG